MTLVAERKEDRDERIRKVVDLVDEAYAATSELKRDTDIRAEHRKTLEMVDVAFFAMKIIIELIKDSDERSCRTEDI